MTAVYLAALVVAVPLLLVIYLASQTRKDDKQEEDRGKPS